MMHEQPDSKLADIPALARKLGLAGLLPQAIAVLLAFDPTERFTALAAGYFYAALIFSFLGGLWWGIAVSSLAAPRWIFAAAVAPSLIAFATGVPWMIGAPWPGPSMIVLGLALFASLMIDFSLARIGLMGHDMLKLRQTLSLGLGGLTLILALLA
jgi:Protein of unknown function (DUF3429)